MTVKKIIAAAIAGVILIGGAGLGFMSWHNHQMQTLRSEMIAQQEANDELQKAINDLANQYGIKIERDGTFKTVVKNLKSKFDQYFQRENYVLDAKEVTSKISDISELGTIKYEYKCVGIMNDPKTIKYLNINNPFEDKTLIIEGNGTIKAGIDLSEVKIKCDHNKKIVYVTIPKSKILSNELDQNSIHPIKEEESWWNQISTDDQSNVRQQIKDKGVECAEASKIYELSGNKAQQVIKDLIGEIQKGKGDYEVQFTAAK